jgi:hypothetical protein
MPCGFSVSLSAPATSPRLAANTQPDNLRYTTAYCLFGYPNATDISSTPCTIEEACGRLEDSIKHGIPDPRGTTAYSYCSAGGSEAMDSANFESCVPCLAAGQTTDYLANCRLICMSRGKRPYANTAQTLWPLKPAVANSPPRACSSAWTVPSFPTPRSPSSIRRRS